MLETNSSLTPAGQEPGLNVLDPASLAQLRSLDPTGGTAFLVRVLETYRRSLERQLALIAEAHDGADHDGLSRAMHTLKSASASVGALQLAALCERVEHQIRRGDLTHLDQNMAAFDGESVRVARAVAELLAEGPR